MADRHQRSVGCNDQIHRCQPISVTTPDAWLQLDRQFTDRGQAEANDLGASTSRRAATVRQDDLKKLREKRPLLCPDRSVPRDQTTDPSCLGRGTAAGQGLGLGGDTLRHGRFPF